MTEYVLREVGRHQWLVFGSANIALWASENEAVTAMTEHAPQQSITLIGYLARA